MKTYEIEYKLSNGDTCCYVFEGLDKAEAIKEYIWKTGCPKSAIISVNKVEKDVDKIWIEPTHIKRHRLPYRRKSDKEKKMLVEACQELLLSIGENTIDLWDANLNDTHSSILWDGGEVTTDYEEGEKTEFEGISEAHEKLYNLIKGMGVK